MLLPDLFAELLFEDKGLLRNCCRTSLLKSCIYDKHDLKYPRDQFLGYLKNVNLCNPRSRFFSWIRDLVKILANYLCQWRWSSFYNGEYCSSLARFWALILRNKKSHPEKIYIFQNNYALNISYILKQSLIWPITRTLYSPWNVSHFFPGKKNTLALFPEKILPTFWDDYWSSHKIKKTVIL